MAVTRWEITTREPYADSATFGTVGAYEWAAGRAFIALDPLHHANRSIVDLVRAERNATGMVEVSTDVVVLSPRIAARGNGMLMYSVVNRGAVSLPFTLGDASTVASMLKPRADGHAAPIGDPILLTQGWTLAWSGWQCDLPDGGGALRCVVPQALEAGEPLRGEVSVQLRPRTDARTESLQDWTLQNLAQDGAAYPAAAPLAQPQARLYVRDSHQGAATLIDRSRWRFARELKSGDIVPSRDHIWLEDGFQTGRLYETVYETETCPVVGCGLASVRDVVADLRQAKDIRHVLAHGISQAGRLLRHFLFAGLNVDERGEQVFDGVFCQYPGAKRGQFNHRYAVPSEGFAQGFATLPPYALASTSRAPGLLDRQRAAGRVPKIMTVASSWEYWRGDASLAHIDPWDAVDVPDPPESRTYLIASSDHMGHIAHARPGRQPLLNESNGLDPTPTLRALLLALVEWVRDGREPPTSRVPRLADGTALPRETVLMTAARIPGLQGPDPDLLASITEIDLGPGVESGIGVYPAVPGPALACFVSALDEDGNEVAGVRVPQVAVPVATLTGWNTDAGPMRSLAAFQGSRAPFPVHGGAPGTPASLTRRYRDRDGYEAAVNSAINELVLSRLLLAEDFWYVREQALAAYDAAISAAPTSDGPRSAGGS